MSPESLLLTIVFLPFAAAAVALLIGKRTGLQTGYLMVGAAASCFLSSVSLFAAPFEQPPAFHYPWLPDLGVNLCLVGDSFGLFFAMLVSGIGTLVGIYSLSYIPELEPGRVGRYYASLIAFMGAMLGISLTDDLILMFVFWEVTSITSFMLIGFWYERDEGRKGANTALQVTALGGLSMLVGFLLVGQVTGTYSIRELQTPAMLQALAESPLYFPALLLVFGGAFTKSAQWPFHFWLPNAMVAPTPVSTYLHAATMVKAGVFLIGRMWPIFGACPGWSTILITIGLITFFLTAYQAFQENDLKAILARTTLSTLGLVMFVYGLNAYEQDALQILNHAVYKGTLFLVVGIVEHATHTRDIRMLGGLRHRMPITCTICVLAALSMAGLPPFFGFLAKEALYAELLHNHTIDHNPFVKWLVIGTCVLGNAFIFATSWKLILGLFWGKETTTSSHAHEAVVGLFGPPAFLAALAVGLGLCYPVTQTMVNAFSSDGHAHVHLALLPAADHMGPLYLSLLTISIGTAIYLGRSHVLPLQATFKALAPPMPWLWDTMIKGVTRFAEFHSRNWQNGRLAWYFAGTLMFFVVVSTMALIRGGFHTATLPMHFDTLEFVPAMLCTLLCVSVFGVVTARTRLGASIAMTATGFLVSLLFVQYRSPDIVLTQILIETVSTIFILLLLYHMPPFRPDRVSDLRRVFNIALSAAVGLIAFVFVLLITSDEYREKANLAADYLGRSLSEAEGRNAVNVIIVDFRAIDTTGEITVLVVVGLCVFGLLRTRREQAEAEAKAVELEEMKAAAAPAMGEGDPPLEPEVSA